MLVNAVNVTKRNTVSRNNQAENYAYNIYIYNANIKTQIGEGGIAIQWAIGGCECSMW